MSAPGLDPTFADLPHRRLGDVALARAQELGATHADFRFERDPLPVPRRPRRRPADRERRRGPRLRGTRGPRRRLGLRLGRRAHRRRGATGRRDGRVRREGRRGDDHHPGRAGPGAGLRRRHLGLGLRHQPARRADRRRRPRCSSSGPSACAPARPSRTPPPFLQQVQENKYYADLAGSRTTQQRVRLQPGFEAIGADEETGIFDSMASIAPPVGRGWEYLTGGSLGLGHRARRGPRAAGGEARRSQRGGRHATTWSSTRPTSG